MVTSLDSKSVPIQALDLIHKLPAAVKPESKFNDSVTSFEEIFIKVLLKTARLSSLSQEKTQVTAGFMDYGEDFLARQIAASGGLGFSKYIKHLVSLNKK